MNRLNQIRLNN